MTSFNYNRTLDLPKALHFLDEDRELLQKLTIAYAASADHNFAELFEAIARHDHSRSRFIMHRVLPTLRLVGTEDVVVSAEELHAALKNNRVTADVFSPSGFLSRLSRLNQEVISSTVRSDNHWQTRD